MPRKVLLSVSRALECRGCRGLGLVEALCLPFLVYSTDMVYILRLCAAMRGLRRSPALTSGSALRAHLGVYAGVVCALVESAGLLRRHVPSKQLLPVLGMQTPQFLTERQLVFRGVWLPKGFRVRDLCRCYNLTSWSLWSSGALSVLKIYRHCVSADCTVPVIIVALRSEVMRIALPTTALYFTASPDGEPAGKHDRPQERLPPSRLRPGRSDSGAAQVEKEILLPPFSRLEPMASMPLSDLRSAAAQAAEGWQLRGEDARRLAWELEDAWNDAMGGRRALRPRDAERCVCLFISKVHGSWLERPEDQGLADQKLREGTI